MKMNRDLTENKFAKALVDQEAETLRHLKEIQKRTLKYASLALDLDNERSKHQAKLVSTIYREGKIEIIWRYSPYVIMMGTGEFPKDVCTKYILESVDNKIVVTSKVEGYIEPEKIIAEQFVYRENANATDV